jgi:hypothetical protein
MLIYLQIVNGRDPRITVGSFWLMKVEVRGLRWILPIEGDSGQLDLRLSFQDSNPEVPRHMLTPDMYGRCNPNYLINPTTSVATLYSIALHASITVLRNPLLSTDTLT